MSTTIAPPAVKYGLFGLVLSFAGLPIYINAPDFYHRQLGASLAILGSIIAVVRVIDAVQDPFIGWWLGKYSTAKQRRRQVLLVGTISLLLGFGLLFAPMLISQTANVALYCWFAGMLVLTTTAFSLLTILHNTLGAELSTDEHQRTRLTAWREGFGVVGLLLASALPTALTPALGPAKAFAVVSGLLTILALPALYLLWKVVISAADDHGHHEAAPSLWQQLYLPLKNQQNRWLYGAFFAAWLAASFPAATVLFFINDYLQAPEQAGWLLGLYFLAAIIAMPLWVTLSKKSGKRQTWLWASLVSGVLFAGVLLLEPGDVLGFAIIASLVGAFLGADLALPPSILADYSDKTDSHQRASYFALANFLTKLSLAVATAIALGLLSAAGFNANEGDVTDVARWVPSVLAHENMLPVVYAGLASAAKLLAAVLLIRLGRIGCLEKRH